MKAKCPLSGLTFQLPGFKEIHVTIEHPIMAAPASKVIGKLAPLFAKGLLEKEELHLFGTFLLSKLPIEHWYHPLLELESLDYWEILWLKNIEQLSAIVLRLEGKEAKAIRHLPKIVISKCEHGHSLSNLKDLIQETHFALNDYFSPISEEAKKRNKQFRSALGEEQFNTEEACAALMNKALRGSLLTSKEQQKFPEVIANWAAKVGNFPLAKFQKDDGKKVSIRDYWKQIIISAFETGPGTLGIANLLSEGVTIEDMDELLEHCSVNIPIGTMQASALFKELEKVKEVIAEFRPGRSFTVVNPNIPTTVITGADLASLLEDVSPLAPVSNTDDTDPLAPKKSDYPTLSSFLAAKKLYIESKKAGESK